MQGFYDREMSMNYQNYKPFQFINIMRRIFLFILFFLFSFIIYQVSAQPAGASCEDALTAVIGTNQADNSHGDQWFKYTATRDGKIVVSTCDLTTEDTYVAVYKDCDGWGVGGNDNYCNLQSRFSFQSKAGTTYYIKWESNTSGKYKWILTEEDPLPGEYCITAMDAIADTNEADNANGDQWFKYTATRNGKILISSCNLTTLDTYLEVYRSCGGMMISSNDNFCNQQSQISFLSNTGETYYIVWRNYKTNGNYNWLLKEVDPSPGEF